MNKQAMKFTTEKFTVEPEDKVFHCHQCRAEVHTKPTCSACGESFSIPMNVPAPNIKAIQDRMDWLVERIDFYKSNAQRSRADWHDMANHKGIMIELERVHKEFSYAIENCLRDNAHRTATIEIGSSTYSEELRALVAIRDGGDVPWACEYSNELEKFRLIEQYEDCWELTSTGHTVANAFDNNLNDFDWFDITQTKKSTWILVWEDNLIRIQIGNLIVGMWGKDSGLTSLSKMGDALLLGGMPDEIELRLNTLWDKHIAEQPKPTVQEDMLQLLKWVDPELLVGAYPNDKVKVINTLERLQEALTNNLQKQIEETRLKANTTPDGNDDVGVDKIVIKPVDTEIVIKPVSNRRGRL